MHIYGHEILVIPRFNHDLQLEIDCIEWALKKIKVQTRRPIQNINK